MKMVSFKNADGSLRCGALMPDGDSVLDFTATSAGLAPPPNYLDWFDLDSGAHRAAAAICANASSDAELRSQLSASGAIQALSEVTLCAPVPNPQKVICIGLNYRDHAIESGMAIPESPVVFSKFPTSITGPNDNVVLPDDSKEVDYEAELAVIIGRRCSKVSTENAMDAVLGYTNCNDVSARDFQFADGQWQRGKSCDTFAPIGEYIATKDEIPDPHNLRIRLHLNGKTLQDSNTNQLIFNIPEIVSFLSRTVTLMPGDVIATGTPPGVGFARKPPIYIQAGDKMEVEIEGLGSLHNPVAPPTTG